VVKAGRMNKRMTFQSQSTTQDSVGQLVETWSDICERTVSIEPLIGREYFNASGQNSEVTTKIRLRYDSTIGALKPYDRGVHGTVVYDIISVINPNERGTELVLMAKRAG
jgi:SPP1 family predicted phage head-tail adaptor